MYEQIVTIILVAVVLGMDAFSLSLCMGLQGVTRKYEAKFISVVAVLHVIMPLVGLSLGVVVGKLLGLWAAWVGALILAYIGLDFLRNGYRELKPQSFSFKANEEVFCAEQSGVNDSWQAILLLGVSVSIDALTVGFSLGTLQMPVLFTVIIMGFMAGIMTLLGFIGGRVFSRVVGSYAQIIGGIILLVLAVKLVL